MTGPADGVDFVEDEEPGGPDEDLPQPPPGRSWRARAEEFRRSRFALPFAVVGVVLAYLVVRALLHQTPAGAPPPTPTPSPSAGSTVVLDPSNGRVADTLPTRTGTEPTRCPGLRCYTAASVPADVRAAVRAVFPTARITAAETIRLVDRGAGDPLWYRAVVARVGPATLTLKVQAHAATGDTPDGGAKDDGARSVSYLDSALPPWFVRVQVDARSGSSDVFDRLATLASDRRLLAVPAAR